MRPILSKSYRYVIKLINVTVTIRYLLNDKQSTLDNYVQYLDTVCELAKIDIVQVSEIVQNNKKNMINKFIGLVMKERKKRDYLNFSVISFFLSISFGYLYENVILHVHSRTRLNI
jgi:hypothetical protein